MRPRREARSRIRWAHGDATESVLVGTSLEKAWDYYFEPSGWPAWVDGFGRVESAQGYPEQDGVLAWSSNPAGRGTVRERVIAHEPAHPAPDRVL